MTGTTIDDSTRAPLVKLLLKHGHVEWDEFDASTVADVVIDGWFADVSAVLVALAGSAREALDVLESHEPGEDDRLERIYRSGNILRAALDAVSDPQRRNGE